MSFSGFFVSHDVAHNFQLPLQGMYIPMMAPPALGISTGVLSQAPLTRIIFFCLSKISESWSHHKKDG